MDLDYLAGLIDGDGCLSVSAVTRNLKSPRHEVRLVVTNTSREIMAALKHQFGGCVSTRGALKGRARKAYGWALRLKMSDIGFLDELRDRSFLKRRQCDILTSLLSRVGICRPAPGRSLSLGEIETRNQLKRELNEANSTLGCPHAGEITAGYAAGFFDAEGAVEILSRRSGQSYRVVVGISNQCRCVLEKLRLRYGGSITPHNGAFRLTIACIQAHRFLVDILPYLIIKKDRAELAIKFRGFIPRMGVRQTEENYRKMESAYLEMANKNLRGANQLRLRCMPSGYKPKIKVTHCIRGHAYDEANTYIHRRKRYCRACHEEGRRRRQSCSC